MPKPPGDLSAFDKVNFVIDSWASPCEAPWYIYVETLWPALLKAFITLATFGWDDVARGYFRPRGLGHRRTGKRKGKWRRAIPAFPELGEEIGKRLPGADEIKGEKWSVLGKTLWRIDTVVQRALFWWLVADVTVDFAYNWTSLLYETVWCQASDKGRFSVHHDGGASRTPAAWWRVAFNEVDYQFPPPRWFVTHGTIGPEGATITAAVAVKGHATGPPPTSFSVRIVNDNTNEVYGESTSDTPDANQQHRVPVNQELPPGARFRVEMRGEGANYTTVSGVCVGREL